MSEDEYDEFDPDVYADESKRAAIECLGCGQVSAYG